MRGALEPLAGVRSVDVSPGKREFSVVYEPQKVTTDQMLKALAEKKEPAKVRG